MKIATYVEFNGSKAEVFSLLEGQKCIMRLKASLVTRHLSKYFFIRLSQLVNVLLI